MLTDGSKLRLARQLRGESVVKLGNQFGLTASHVYSIELGRRRITPQMRKEYAPALRRAEQWFDDMMLIMDRAVGVEGISVRSLRKTLKMLLKLKET